MFKFLLLTIILSVTYLQVKTEIIQVDKYDYEFLGWNFDHVESRRFYATESEAVGIRLGGTPPPEHMGVWVFESHGPGGCCGGRLDLIAPMFDPQTDKVEILVTFATNKPFSFGGMGKNGEHLPVANSRVIINPNNSTIINWRTEVLSLPEGSRWGTFQCYLGSDRSGYLFLDKIIIAKNEPIPEYYF